MTPVIIVCHSTSTVDRVMKVKIAVPLLFAKKDVIVNDVHF